MRWEAATLALGLLATACGKAVDPVSSAPQLAQEAVLDPRVAPFFENSMLRGHYDVTLSDIPAVLIETLMTGDHDAQARAKKELADQGLVGVDALRRLVDRYRTDPEGVNYLRNAVDALALSERPEAAVILTSLLEHPSDSLQVQAMRCLLTHPQPNSFDAVLQFLANASEVYQGEVCSALGKLDPLRAQRLWMEWIEQRANKQLWQHVLPAIAGITDPELTARAQALLERDDLDRMTRFALCTPAARIGDDTALGYLRTQRESKNPTERDLAVRALAAAEQLQELAWTLAHDDYANIRMLVVRAATQRPGTPAARLLLEQATNDADETVRQLALGALSTKGGQAAIDQTLGLLDSPSLSEVAKAVQLLGEGMRADPALAERVWFSLRPRLEALSLRTPGERAMLIKILGLIPLREVTLMLQELAVASQGDLEMLRAQRFVLMQSVNAGVVAQDALFELWSRSTDPLLRLDAIEAIAAPGGARSRELLLRIFDDPRTTPQELVFIADRLARIGPASEIAWQLKRAAPSIADPIARQALQGILWRWYPAPRH